MKKKVICFICIIVIAFCNVSFASWIDDGYSWARNNGIIGTKTTSQLLKNMTAEDFYTMLFKYFDKNPTAFYASVQYQDDYFKMDDYKTDNYILVSMDRELTKIVAKEWITNAEYKKGITLIENAQNILNKNGKYFTDEEKQNIEYYLKVMRYLLREKIYDNEFKLTQYASVPLNGPKFIEYRLIPYYGVISREEFLNLMYKYSQAHNNTFSTGQCIGYYIQQNVLKGYDNNFMLAVKLNYAHFTTFLSRM